MEILNENSNLPQRVSLILGFFDGVHAGHIEVLNNTPINKRVVVTFSSSPSQYFQKEYSSIYTRTFNYELMENLGIDYIYEQNFANIAHLSANDYLKMLLDKFNPVSITTGFNHTFGVQRLGNTDFLRKNQTSFNYFCTPPTIIDNKVVSSTLIKKIIQVGDVEKVKEFLTRNFVIESRVIKGEQRGRQIGFPTANLKYPKNIVKLPYGVYKVKVLGLPAVLNWGVKPTFNSEELLEVHIPNFKSNLYDKNLKIEIIKRIRNEIKFNSLEELKVQIEKDVEECLK